MSCRQDRSLHRAKCNPDRPPRDSNPDFATRLPGGLLACFAGHQEDIEAVAFFPGGTRLISASEDKTIKVWDITERRVLLTAIGFSGRGLCQLHA